MVAATHRLVGGSTGFVIGTAAGFPLVFVGAVSVLAAAASTLPDDLERVFRLPHRQVTHYPSIQLAVIVGIAALIASLSPFPDESLIYITGALALACVMHSVADSMTIDRRGIALLWPIRSRGYHLLPRPMRAKVGSRSLSEITFAVIWSVIVLIYAYARFRHHLPS